MLLFAFVATSLAQYPNWGWGPAITISQNGMTLNCSVFDPFLNTTRTTSVSNVDNYQYADGILAYVTPGGTVGGVTYDVNIGSWRTATFSGSSNTTIQNRDGVIAWVTGGGTVGGAVYDPNVQSWRYTTFSGSSNTLIDNQDGIVAWVTGGGTVGGAVYDPALQSWRYTTFSGSSNTSILNSDGVVAWVTGGGTVGGAVYDISLQSWRYTTFSGSSNTTIVNASGTIGWLTGGGTIGGAAYDHNLQSWRYTTFSGSSSNTGLYNTDGTIFWTGSSGLQHEGYNFSTQNWQSNQNTELNCKMFVAQASGNAPLISYFWCMSVGANSYSYNSRAGHTITRRWGYKQYDNVGTFTPELTVFNSITNHLCNETVTVGGVGVAEAAAAYISISPNPLQQGDRLEIKATKAIRNVSVCNMMGVAIYQTSAKSSSVSVDLSDLQLASGIYFVEVLMDGNAAVRRKILVE